MSASYLTLAKKLLLVAVLAIYPYGSALSIQAPEQTVATPVAKAAGKAIVLPERIPANCLNNAAERYKVPSIALLAIMKQESNGRVGVIGKNKNGSRDIGPAQLNTSSWAKYMVEKHNIPISELRDNMCQALMAQAYALRYEWNTCIQKRQNPDIWCAIAYYHSPTPKYQRIYVEKVWAHYQRMIRNGRF